MIVALDVLLSTYQGILLIYLARKQFILKPHSFLVEIGCVMAVTLYFAGIQYLGIPIPDNFVIIIVFIYFRLATQASWVKAALWTLLDGFIFAGTLTIVTYFFDIQININGSISAVMSDDIRIVFMLSSNAALTVVVNVAARLIKVRSSIPTKETIVFIVMLAFEFMINECFYNIRFANHIETVLIAGSSFAFVVMILTMVLYEYLTTIAEKRRIDELEARTLQMTHEHQEELENIYREMLRQQHDLQHRVTAVEELLSSGDLTNDTKDAALTLLNQPHDNRLYFTGCITVDAIIKSKATAMENAGIRFEFVEYPLKPLPIPEDQFCVLLSNLLDNAIEGVMRLPATSNNRHIKLTFSKAWDMLFVTCTNDADSTKIIRFGNDFVSEKPQPELHGFGTRSIKKIVEDAGGTIEFEINKGQFTVQIIL